MYALIFPGQGSQYVGMGQSLYAASPTCKAVFDEVDDAVNFSLSSLMFTGDAEALRLTENVQPALMAVSVALIKLWLELSEQKDISGICQAVAGHSLGEYSALTAAGAIGIADAARTLKARGEAMQKAVPVGKGGMVAVLGMDIAAVTALAAEVNTSVGICEIANDNAPGQIVLSGTSEAMAAVVAQAKAHGAKRVLPLPVSAPFHCSMMGYARDAMAERLADLKLYAPVVPCYANVDTKPTQDVETIRQNLVAQICSPVCWRESISQMVSDGVENFTEVGAGKVLVGLCKRISSESTAVSVQEYDDLLNHLSAE